MIYTGNKTLVVDTLEFTICIFNANIQSKPRKWICKNDMKKCLTFDMT